MESTLAHTKQGGKKRQRDDKEEIVKSVVDSIGLGKNWASLKSRLMKSQSTVTGAAVKAKVVVAHNALPPSNSSLDVLNLDAETLVSAKTTVTGPFLAEAPLSGEQRRYLALDCEMVGVGPSGMRSSLAQVVIVDWLGRVVLNKYVKPGETVVDYRTAVSGITPRLLRDAESFAVVQREVSKVIEGKFLVGHGLENDLKALLLSHPASRIRDTARYKAFCWRDATGSWRPRKLKHLVHHYLQLDIQTGSHEPAEDARGALALYKAHRRPWEHGLLGDPKATQVPKGSKATHRKKMNRVKRKLSILGGTKKR